ncbi:MAG: hypothetical protein ACON5H_05245 [Akkermansiaceae bacterium]
MTVVSIAEVGSKSSMNDVHKNYISINSDWFGNQFFPSPKVSFAVCKSYFHFLSKRKAPARVHPRAIAGDFQAELWKYDVAEFFLAAPNGDDYLEFNLAPNGAWWSSFFSSPREQSRNEPLANVITKAEMTAENWEARASIPLTEIPWPLEECSLNATLILETPNQRYLTLADLGGGEPDFHRPAHFLPISLSSEAPASHTLRDVGTRPADHCFPSRH